MLNTDKKDFQFYRGNTLMLRCKCSNVLLGYKKKPRMTLIRISLETKVKLTKLFLFPRGENHKNWKKCPYRQLAVLVFQWLYHEYLALLNMSKINHFCKLLTPCSNDKSLSPIFFIINALQERPEEADTYPMSKMIWEDSDCQRAMRSPIISLQCICSMQLMSNT